MPKEERASIFRDPANMPPVLWEREPESDIDCAICLFEIGCGKAWAYRCYHGPKIGTRVYYCPRHQKEVSPLIICGEPLLAGALAVLFNAC